MKPAEQKPAQPGREGVVGRVIFRTGIALVLISLALALRYSIEAGWFGAGERIAAAGTASAALVASGLLAKKRAYGRILIGAGAAGGYGTVWAAHSLYGMTDITVALAQLVGVAGVGLALAVKERSDILAALALGGVSLAPSIVGGTFIIEGGEALYQIGALAVAGVLYAKKHWWRTSAAVVVISGATLISANPARADDRWVLAGMAAWWLVGWAQPILGRLGDSGREPDEREERFDAERGSEESGEGQKVAATGRIPELTHLATLIVPVLTWTTVWRAAPNLWTAGLSAAALGATHLYVWIREKQTGIATLHLLAAIGFGGIGVLVLAGGKWIATPLYLLLAAAAAVYGNREGRDDAEVTGTIAAIPALMGWLAAEGAAQDVSVWLQRAGEDLAAVAVIAGAAAAANGSMRRLAAGTAYTMAAIWAFRHLGAVDTGLATAGIAAVGTVALIGGRLRQQRAPLLAGLVTITVAVVKLVFWDLATAGQLVKIAVTFGLGLTLLGIGYWVGDTVLMAGDAPEDGDGQLENTAESECEGESERGGEGERGEGTGQEGGEEAA